MKTLFLDCTMGAAGDMLTAALLELFPNPREMLQRLNEMNLPGVTFTAEKTVKCGITGTSVRVRVHGESEESHFADCAAPLHGHTHCHPHDHEHGHHHDHAHDHEHERSHDHPHDCEHGHPHGHPHPHEHGHGHHSHAGMGEITALISALNVPDCVKTDAQEVYRLIAEAESRVHGATVEQIHFHEVGTMDAVADVAAVCLLMHELRAEQVLASPVHVGSGQVRCAHGIMPVPAPATALLLQGIPTCAGEEQGELCTPTGAALLRHFVQRFEPQPLMRVNGIGYGMGKRDFKAANCLRVLLGDAECRSQETVLELKCNLDDMTAEDVGYVVEVLLQAGAPDVYTTPIQMKKNRPATELTVLCKPEQREELTRLLFVHTTTLGVRAGKFQRDTLSRRNTTVTTPYGEIRVKQARGYGVSRCKPEYDDVSACAKENGVSLAQVRRAVENALQT